MGTNAETPSLFKREAVQDATSCCRFSLSSSQVQLGMCMYKTDNSPWLVISTHFNLSQWLNCSHHRGIIILVWNTMRKSLYVSRQWPHVRTYALKCATVTRQRTRTRQINKYISKQINWKIKRTIRKTGNKCRNARLLKKRGHEGHAASIKTYSNH